MTAATLGVFALTYLLIAFRRIPFLPIGRPAGALFGATLMVAIGALTPKESYDAIDGDTLVLLFATMLLTAYLRFSGFFELAARFLTERAGSPLGLLVLVALGSAFLSAWLVNDTVCVFLTPVVVATCTRARLPLGPYLIALATSANLGSAATLVGNPQNMIIGSLSKLPFVDFLAVVGPAAAAATAANVVLLIVYYRRVLPRTFAAADGPDPDSSLLVSGAARRQQAAIYRGPHDLAPPVRRHRLVLPALVTLGVMAGFLAGLHLGYTALAGAVVLMIATRRDPRDAFALVDWPLLVFFASLFVVMGALGKTGLAQETFDAAAPHMDLRTASGAAVFSGVFTFGSNVFSNVPVVLLGGPHVAQLGTGALGFALLGYVTTVAGNLTLIGSVANLIVAESARDVYKLGFVEYLRFGAVSTLVSLVVGAPIVCALA